MFLLHPNNDKRYFEKVEMCDLYFQDGIKSLDAVLHQTRSYRGPSWESFPEFTVQVSQQNM